MALDARDLADLGKAKRLLENASLAARLTDLVGKPIEKGVEMLPASAAEALHGIVRSALERALGAALATMAGAMDQQSKDGFHRLATATTGAVGGFFGLAGIGIELPVTTMIMLRSIGDIARSEGHALDDPTTRLACLEVFALGGQSPHDDASETGYYAVRAGLASLVGDAARHVAEHGMASRGAPVIVNLLEKIAARFGLAVQEKVALQLMPVIGAASGALINTIFMSHFQNAARGHFIVRRLEKTHGDEAVRQAYAALEVS
jgi:hypothetical protein